MRASTIPLLIRSIENKYLQFWKEELATSKKLDFYCKFKQGFYSSTSVDILRNTGARKVFMKLYISNHKLLIETGRHCRPKLPREERLCKFCPLNKIEDEMHLLFICNLYNDRRLTFMKDQKRILGVNIDNYDNLALALFTTESKASIRANAKFITECFILRNN